MRKLLIISLLALCSQAFGQAARFDSIALSTASVGNPLRTVTVPLPGASITVCTYPANGSLPCTNKASLCPDITAVGCTSTAPNNPITADARGNFGFWAPSGVYQYTICPVSGVCQGPYIAHAPVASDASGNLNFGTPSVFTKNVTINNASGGGANDLTLGIENQVRWACSLSGNYRFKTIASALADVQSNTTNGAPIFLCPGHTESAITSTTNIGDNSNNYFTHLMGSSPSSLTFNVTGGAKALIMKNETAMVGQNLGAYTGTTGGFKINYPATANIQCLVCSDDSGSYNGFLRLENIFMAGNPSATVTGAVLEIGGVSNQSSYKNLFAYNFGNTIGIRIRDANNANGVTGPLSMDNIWSDGNYNAGAVPCQIDSIFTHSIISIDWNGGICNHPGSGQTMFSINGNGNTGHPVRGITIHGTYLENFLNGNSKGIAFADVLAAHAIGVVAGLQPTDTAFDISQTVAHATNGISVIGSWKTNGGTVAINNHITGFTDSHTVIPFYSYGGDVGSSITPFTIESNNFQILDGANHVIFSVPAQTTSAVTSSFTGTFGIAGIASITSTSPVTNQHLQLLDSANVASKTNLYSFLDGASGTTFRVDPLSPDGTHDALVEFFRSTNTSSTRKINIFKGDNTSTVTANIDASTGLGTFTGGIVAGSAGSTISDTRELVQSAHSCGTTTTCANTANGSYRMIFGTVALSSATPSTATVTAISPAFTSSSSYVCTATPTGATAAIAAGGIAITYVSGSSFTLTGPATVTTVINYNCIGN